MRARLYDIVIMNNEDFEMDVGIVVAIQNTVKHKQPLYQIRDAWYGESAIKRVLGNALQIKSEIDMESEQ